MGVCVFLFYFLARDYMFYSEFYKCFSLRRKFSVTKQTKTELLYQLSNLT